MASLSNDVSQLAPFGLMDIINHLIMSKTDYDKGKLFSWCSFEEYNLCTNGHVQSLGVNTTEDLDGSAFFVFVAGVIPTQNEKTHEGDKLYRLWFVLDSTGSAYSAFCRCKGGADQECRHLGANLFELDDFLSNQRKSVTSMSAYWNPMPTPTLKPVPMSEMKVSQSSLMKKERKITPYDDSWIDSFDPRPMKGRKEITLKEKIDLQRNFEKLILVLVFLIFYHFPHIMMKMKMKIFLLISIIIYLTGPYYPKLRIMSRQTLISYRRTTF